MRNWVMKWAAGSILLGVLGLAAFFQPARASLLPQVATGSVPTVTGTASGPMAVVKPGPEPQINIRSGPNTVFDKVGVLLVGQSVPALGRSSGGEWIQVKYPGVEGGTAWVWSAYVEIVPSVDLPIIEPPPSPTPKYTVTVDPTLASRFIVTAAPTRLPTYTAPPALSIPTFIPADNSGVGRIPMGFIILGLAAMGVLFGLVAFFQGR